jgi:WD40 repeat protein
MMSSPLRNTIVIVCTFIFFCLGTINAQEPTLVLQTGHLDAKENESSVNSIRFSPDNKFILTGARDGQVKLWHTETGKLVYTLPADNYSANADFAGGGEYIITGGSSSLKGWKTATGQLLYEIKAADFAFMDYHLSPDGQYLAAWKDDKLLILAVANGKIIDSIAADGSAGEAVMAGFAATAPKIFFIRNNKVIERNYLSHTDLRQYGNGDDIRSLLAEDDKLVIIYYSRTVEVYNHTTGKKLSAAKINLPEFSNLVALDASLILGVKYDRDNSTQPLQLFNAGNGTVVQRFSDSVDVNGIPEYCFDKKNSLLAYSNKNHQLVIYNLKSRSEEWRTVIQPWEKGFVFGKRNYIGLLDGNRARYFDLATKESRWLEGAAYNITKSIIAANGSVAATHSKYGSQIKIWNPKTGQLRGNFERKVAGYNYPVMYMSADAGHLLTYTKNTGRPPLYNVWNLPELRLQYTVSNMNTDRWPPQPGISNEESLNMIRLSATQRQYHALLGNTDSEEEQFVTLSLDSFAVTKNNTAADPAWQGNNFRYRYNYIVSGDDSLLALNNDKGELIIKSRVDSNRYTYRTRMQHKPQQFFDNNRQLLTIGLQDSSVATIDITGKRIIGKQRFAQPVIMALVSSSGDYLLVHTAEKNYTAPQLDEGSVIYIIHRKTGKTVSSIRNLGFFPVVIRFGKNEEEIFVAEAETRTLIYSSTTGKKIKELNGELASVNLERSWPEKYLLSFTPGAHFVWDAHTLKPLYTFYTVDSAGYFTRTPDGYYMCTPGAARMLHYVTKENDIITFDQLDIKYNRPDKVLEYIGNDDTALIRSYRRAYEKRIKRLGIDTAAFNQSYKVPVAELANSAAISYLQNNNRLQLRIKASDEDRVLDRLHVFINDVPFFGKKGIDLRHRKSKTLDTTISITLAPGENSITASVMNSNGMESYRKPKPVFYQPAAAVGEKLYFIGIGIDEFKESEYNLKYSVKDIRNLAETFKKKYGSRISIDTLFNNKVTASAVTRLKDKLKQSNENDKVIVAYSGHGLLSKDLDYYLSTYPVSFTHPEENGLPYEELENLLDNIPARKKLMLIDACHSGEVDKEEMLVLNKTADSLGLSKGIIIEQPQQQQHVGLKNSFELMQSLFVNVGKSTGATIISAAAGNQFALERGDLENGVFTYSILEALSKFPTLKISELKKIVGDRVQQLTHGLQKPTSRNENISADWTL